MSITCYQFITERSILRKTQLPIPCKAVWLAKAVIMKTDIYVRLDILA